MKSKSICSFAATDSSGHAGLLADLRVFDDLGLHGSAVVTAVTSQNSTSFTGVTEMNAKTIASQWQALNEDLSLPLIKVGIICNEEQLSAITQIAKTARVRIVLDPIRSSSVGSIFPHSDKFRKRYISFLSYCEIVTPDIPGAEWLLKRPINSYQDVEKAAASIRKMGARNVLIRGTHLEQSNDHCCDFFCGEQQQFWLTQKRLSVRTKHGTSCVLSSAIASFLAHGKHTYEAIVLANAYLQAGLKNGFFVGNGNGIPANTDWPKNYADFPSVSNHPCIAVAPETVHACEPLGLYPVVDSIEWLERLLKLNIKTIQICPNCGNTEELEQTIAIATDLGRRHAAQLFIPEHVQAPLNCRANGTH